MSDKKQKTLIIGCGAIAYEIKQIIELNNWENVTLKCLNANLHNHPKKIPEKIQKIIESNQRNYSKIFLAYADCGTGGMIDKIVKNYGIQRLKGAHCYEFFSGSNLFRDINSKEIGTFYLTDFLVKHFDRLVIDGLGISKHPHLKKEYFKNYKRVVYLAQNPTTALKSKAKRCADILNLEFSIQYTGLDELSNQLKLAEI